MSRTLFRWFPLFALLGQLFPAYAETDRKESVKQAVQQCVDAKTSLACRAALPVCEAALAIRDRLPADRQTEMLHDPLLNGSAQCEYALGQYEKVEVHYRSQLADSRR